MRRSNDSCLSPLFSSSSSAPPRPWLMPLLLVCVCLLAQADPCAAAPAGVVPGPVALPSSSTGGKDNSSNKAASTPKTPSSASSRWCDSPFQDPASSALLADVVLEGRLRQKISPRNGGGGGASGDGGPLARYDIIVQVRKQVWKGKEVVNGGRRARKLRIGTFTASSSDEEEATTQSQAPAEAAASRDSSAQGGDGRDETGNEVVVSRRVRRRSGRRRGGKRKANGGGGGGGDGGDGGARKGDKGRGGSGAGRKVEDCDAGDLQDGATYVFFLRRSSSDHKGRYFEVSALPVKKNRRVSRIVKKILRKNAAKKPNIQRLKSPRSVTKGYSMTLRCKAKAKPNPVFTWYHNGVEIASTRGQKIKNSKRSSRLKISRADENSAGVYTCKASNAVGSATKNVTIKVLEEKLSQKSYRSSEYMNEDAKATYSVKAPKMAHKLCEKQTYCFNGGTCRYLPDLHQTFCQCPKKWAGQRCELLDIKTVILQKKNGRAVASVESDPTLLIVGIAIALLVFIVICIASYFLSNRRRKRWLAKRRLRQSNLGPQFERAQLLDNNKLDGAAWPQYLPSHKPQAQKETQTDDTLSPPDPPANHVHDLQPNSVPATAPGVPDNIFLRDRSFPHVTTAVLTSTASPVNNSHSNGQRARRPVSDKLPRELERRGSRSRLKAVSVDDSCKDRPPSWRAGGVPDSQSMPAIKDSEGAAPDPPEAIELVDRLPERQPARGGRGGPRLSDGDDVDGGMNARLEDGRDASSASPPPRSVPSPTAMIEVEAMPQAAVRAAQPTAPPADDLEAPPPKPYYQPAPPSYADVTMSPTVATWQGADDPQPTPHQLGFNGRPRRLYSDEEEEDGDGPESASLPRLHISEEDLSGKDEGQGQPGDSEYWDLPLPPPPPPISGSSAPAGSGSGAFPPRSLPSWPVSYGSPGGGEEGDGEGEGSSLLPGPAEPSSLDSASDEDSAGFMPLSNHALSPIDASPSLSPQSPQREAYAYDPCMDSDHELDDQFMHGSPKKKAGRRSARAGDKEDLERRLLNVRADQEAIPI